MSLNALYIVPILGLLIILHELGHFWAARRAGMRVEEFGLGIPPRLWGVRRGDTLYSLNAIPLGGFVKVLGEDGKEYSSESMQSKSVGQRALFITAGALMNFAAAFVILLLLVAFQGKPIERVYVVNVVPGSPAAQAGWLVGDRFVSIDNQQVDDAATVQTVTNRRAGQSITVVLQRGNEQVETAIVPRENPPPGEGRTGIQLAAAPQATLTIRDINTGGVAATLGLRPGDRLVSINGRAVTDFLLVSTQLERSAGGQATLDVLRDGQTVTIGGPVPATIAEDSAGFGATVIENRKYASTPVYNVPVETAKQYVNTIRQMGAGLASLVRGEQSLSSVAGPIGMGQLTSEVINASPLPLWVTLGNIAFILSLNLGLLNLLPLPALDGGRLIFVIVEVLRRGKRVAPEREGVVHFVGLVVLLTLMFAIAFVDVNRVVSGGSLLQ